MHISYFDKKEIRDGIFNVLCKYYNVYPDFDWETITIKTPIIQDYDDIEKAFICTLNICKILKEFEEEIK